MNKYQNGFARNHSESGFAHLVLIIGVMLVGIVGIGYLVARDSTLINPIPKVYQQTGVDYWRCEQDSDCVIAINPSGCCYCPDSINKNHLGQNKWEKYEEGKTYTPDVECDLLCEQCAIPGKPICQNNLCTWQNTSDFIDADSDNSEFICPETEVLDCTPCEEGALCPNALPQYCYKSTPQYNWIIENCSEVTIINAT